MSSEPLAAGGLLSTHWTVVLVVGLIFFSLQVVLSLRIVLSLRRQERLLLRLCQDLDRGGDGLGAIDMPLDSFPWLRWVIAIFPAEAIAPRGSYTRDSVLQELDARLASDSSYLLLQRMGVMAPLLGVILTVAGFWYLRVEESGEMRLQDILFAVVPLVSGVGAGAVLALVNQGLVHWTSQRIESLRMVARTWFDLAIWNSVGLDSQSATVKAIAAVEHMAAAISDAADRQTDCANRLTASAAAINDSACELRGTVQDFGGRIQGVPKALGELTSAIAASSTALESLIHVGSRAVANLDVSVAAFRTTLDRDFASVARQQLISTHDLADAIRQIGTTTEFLKLSSQDLKEFVDSSKTSFRSLSEALEHQLVPGQLQFQTSVDHLTARLEVLTNHLESLAGQVNAITSNHILPEAATSFSESAMRLSSIINEGLSQATKRLTELDDTLSGFGGTLAALQRFSLAGDDIDRLTESLARATNATETIADLPEEICGILEHAITEKRNHTTARVRIMNWFRARAAHSQIVSKE